MHRVISDTDFLKNSMRASVIGTEMQHLEIQFRIVAVLLCGMLLFDFIDPAIFIMNVPDSIIAKVAAMTHQGHAIAWAFIGMGILVVPYIVMTVFFPRHPCRRECTKAAVLGMAGAALAWFFLAWTARNTEFPYVLSVYFRSGVGALSFSMALALSLNNELARTLLDR